MGDRQKWILLIHQLPAKPTNLRVRIWRKLQNFGAILIKNSVYILPFNEKTNEDFQWLKQEIESAGGETTIFRADSVEGATDKEIISAFQRQADDDYSRLIAEFDGLSGALHEQKKTKSLSANKLAQHESEFSKINQEFERVLANDFFHAANRKKAKIAIEKCRAELQAAKGADDKVSPRKNDSAKVNLNEYQSRRWVTRKDPHIDRLASAWLIKRFIDRRPRFQFVAEGERVGNAVSFDMVGATFTHRGEDCTFETLIRSFGLNDDVALKEIGEIVHDIDLKDSKFNRSEAGGVNAIISGIADNCEADNERLKQCFPLFDGLYKLFQSSDESRSNRTGSKKERKGLGIQNWGSR